MTSFVEVATHDFDCIASHVHAWDVQLKQLGAGKFKGSIASLRLGPISCMQWSTSHKIVARGVLRRPAVVFTPIVQTNLHANWRGHTLLPQQVNILGPRDVMDHVTSTSYVSTSLILENQFLNSLAARQWDIDVDASLQRCVALQLDREAHLRLLELPRLLLTVFRSGGHLTEAEVVEQASDVILQAILSQKPDLISRTDGNSRQRIINQVNEFLAANQHRVVYVSELCRAAHCSERTLQYAITERYGVTPKVYLQHHRLNGVRQHLKQSIIQRSTIGTVARRWGFHHTGEFAAGYYRLFGELPSETLRRYGEPSTLIHDESPRVHGLWTDCQKTADQQIVSDQQRVRSAWTPRNHRVGKFDRG